MCDSVSTIGYVIGVPQRQLNGKHGVDGEGLDIAAVGKITDFFLSAIRNQSELSLE
jgi:hypothetical protein